MEALKNPMNVDKASLAYKLLFNYAREGNVEKFNSVYIEFASVYPAILDQRHFELASFVKSTPQPAYPITRSIILALSLLTGFTLLKASVL